MATSWLEKYGMSGIYRQEKWLECQAYTWSIARGMTISNRYIKTGLLIDH